MIIYYGGEDEVTSQVAKRLALKWAKSKRGLDFSIENLNLRARGRRVLEKLDSIIELGKTAPVVFVIDSDTDCPVNLLEENCNLDWEATYSSINIAVDEAEAWLLADRKGIAAFLGIRQLDIPDNIFAENDLRVKYKTSLFIMMELVPKSKKRAILDSMSITEKAGKPPTYNKLWPKFIADDWDIDAALKHSDSLRRALHRTNERLDSYIENLTHDQPHC